MKLTDLKPQSSHLTLLHPITGKPLKTDSGKVVKLEVIGRDSQQFFAHQKNQIKNISRGKDLTKDITAENLQKMVIEQLAVTIIGWSDDVNEFFASYDTKKGGGKYSHNLCVKLVGDGELGWLRDQLDAFLDERANFFKG